MSDAIDLGSDPGIVLMRLPGRDEPCPVDVYEANNRLFDLRAATAEQSELEKGAAVVALMADLGLPKVSHYLANVWAAKVIELADGLAEKKDGAGDAAGTPGSPASTAPASTA